MFFKRVIKIRTQLGAAVQRTGKKKKKKKTVVAVMERGLKEKCTAEQEFFREGVEK